MTKLAILSLAVTALVPASLMAQTVAPPEPWQDVPDVELDLPGPPPAKPIPPARPAPPPGVTWQRPAAPPPAVAPAPAPVRPTPQAQVAPPRAVAPAPRVAPAPAPPPPARVAPAPAPPPPAAAIRTLSPPPAAPRVSRVERGYVMPPYWMGPQFHVREWDAYGFVPPAPDQRWVRYYDEALLVDRYGRVIDMRHDVDWDERGEAWAYDPRGIPVYVGDGDFYPDADDYAYVEGYGEEAYADAHDGDGYYEDDYGYAYGPPAHGACEATYDPGHYPPPPCFHGGYPPYGYGYGWGGVTITETTVTTYGCCAEPQVVVKEYPAKKVRHYKRKRAHRGEKG